MDNHLDITEEELDTILEQDDTRVIDTLEEYEFMSIINVPVTRQIAEILYYRDNDLDNY